MKIILITIMLLLVGVGCQKELDHQFGSPAEYCLNLVGDEGYELEMLKYNVEELEKQVGMIKEYLDVIEVEEYCNYETYNLKTKEYQCHRYKTILTKDPIKKEWEELGCDKFNLESNTTTINNILFYGNNKERCKELKNKI